MLNKRNSPRRKMVLPVKDSIDEITRLAHTIDITHTGARLGALRMPLQPGMIISLQRRSKKAKFRITWTRQVAPNELQAGVESLELPYNFWGVDLSEERETKNEVKALMTILSSCLSPTI